MSRKRLSLVVPIYNSADFLEECLDSVLDQSALTDYEVVLIDDGSTDDSARIARIYSEKYSECFRYVRQNNSGVSVARNHGIEVSHGEYILFLDSDDRLHETGLSDLLQHAEEGNLDIAQGNFSHFGEGYGAPFLNRGQILCENLEGKRWLFNALRERKFTGAPWVRLYRRKFLLDKNLRFAEGIINAEDQLFTIQSYFEAENVSSYDIPFYQYRHRTNSITNTLDVESNIRKAHSDLIVCHEFEALCKSVKNRGMEKLVMERCIKLLTRTFKMLEASGTPKDSYSVLLARADELNLYRYVRFTRLSYVFDWIRLRKGFAIYLDSKK